MSISLRYHNKPTTSRNRLEWQPINEKLFSKLYREIAKYDVYSDTVVSNMWAYMGSHAKVYFGNNGIILRLLKDYSNEPYYTVLAGSNAREVIAEFVRTLPQNKKELVLLHVSSETTQNLRGWKAVNKIVSDRANHDYIYSVDRLIDFDNRKLKRRAKEITKLKINHPEIHFAIGTQKDKKLVHDIIAFCTTQYLEKRHHDPDYWDLELLATKRLLRQKTAIMELIVAYDGKYPIGFNINEPLHNNFYLGHKGKADRSYKGLSFYLEHESAKHMKEKHGSIYLNNMMDLGIEGLRTYKKSWGPLRMLRKYTVYVDVSKI